MATFENLRAAIDQYITANGNKEITGTILNEILQTMVTALGANYQVAGVATPSTNPGQPEQKVVYFASQAGTYTNFDSVVLPLGIHLLMWNGISWSHQTFFTIDDEPTAGSDNLVKSGGVFNTLFDSSNIYENANKDAFTKPGRYVSGLYSADANYKSTEKIPVKPEELVSAYLGSGGGTNTDAISFFKEDGSYLSRIGMSATVALSDYDATVPSDAAYVAFTHFNSGGFIDKETYSITYQYYNLRDNKYLVDKLQNRLNGVDGNGKYEYPKMFSAVTNYSVVENRYITINGVQGNADWCNLYSFTTEVNRIYAIYGTASNVNLPLAYYQENGIVNQYDGKLVFILGDGTTIYINSKSDTLLIYEFIMSGYVTDPAIINRLNAIDGNGKYEYSKMFSSFVGYSVVDNRFITYTGVQGNAAWCNLYSFTTEVNRIYAIYGTADNQTLPLAFYQGNGITNLYNGKLVFVVGDGSTIYINSKSDTILIYEFIMSGSSADVAIPHEIEILQQYDNIVCCGDSLTYGAVYYGSEAKQALNPYPKVLGKLTGCNVANIASGGYSAKDWWDNYNTEITGANKLYIIYLGVNGQLTDTVDTDCVGDDYTTYANTNTGSYGKIIQKILDSGSQVVLIGIEQMLSSSIYSNTIKAVNSLATRFGVPKVDSPAKYLYADAYHRAPGSSDINSIHLNNLGYAKFASILVHEISNLSPEEQYKLQPVQ